MKKVLFFISASAFCFLISCSGKKEGSGGMSDGAKKNLEANDAIVKMFESGDFSKVGDYIDKDAVDHAGMKGDVVGIDNIKAQFDGMKGMMENMKSETIKELADDEYVMCWIKQSSTAKMDLPEMGMKKGQSATMNTVEVSKYNKDHKVTDHWSFADMNEMMKMMGGGAPPPPMEAKDTTGK